MTETKITSRQLRDSYLEYLHDVCNQIVEEIKKVARNGPSSNIYIKDMFEIQDKIVMEKLVEMLKEQFLDVNIRFFNKILLRESKFDKKNYYSITAFW